MAKTCVDLVWIIVTYNLFVSLKNAKFVESFTSTHLIMSVLTPVVFDCKCDEDNIGWTYDKTYIVNDNRLLSDNFPGNITYFENKSIGFNAVTIQNDGIYQCFCKYDLVKEYNLTVEVPPEVYISIDYQNITDGTHYFEANKNHTVTCRANGTKPAVNLTWKKNGKEITAPLVTLNVTVNAFNRKLHDSVATLWIEMEEEQGNLTCTSSSQTTSNESESRVNFLTYVSPTVFLRVNGHNASESVYVNVHEKGVVVCTAKRARPAANLTVLVNGTVLEHLNATEYQYTSERSQVFVTSVYGEISLDGALLLVTCHSRGRYGYLDVSVNTTVHTYVNPEVTLSINGSYIENGTTYVNTENDRLIIICRAHGALTPVYLTLNVTGDYVFLDKFKKRNKSGFDTEEAINLKPRKGKTTVKCLSFCQHCREEQSHYVEVETVGSFPLYWVVVAVSIVVTVSLIYLVIKLRESLVGLLLSNPNDGYVESAEDEENKTVNEEDHRFQRSDVTLISRLPGEGVFRYWKAMASGNIVDGEKFVAKSVSEFAQLKDLYSFRDGAKRMVALPKHTNIVDTIGVAIEDVPYYIYQEYIDCGTLRDYILRNYQKRRQSQISSRGSLNESKVEKKNKVLLTAFSLDACEGMSFLALHNFRHPALSSCKVLLTKALTCKLYDFVHDESSDDRVQHILEQKNAPIAWLPPETIFFRQYSAQADVWSLAVLLWEIYSLGDIPYAGLKSEDIEKKIRNGTYLSQPLHCPGGVFGMMLASWDISPQKRPVFENIAETLRKIIRSLKEQYSESGEHAGLTVDPTYFTLDESHSHNDYEEGSFKSLS